MVVLDEDAGVVLGLHVRGSGDREPGGKHSTCGTAWGDGLFFYVAFAAPATREDVAEEGRHT